MVYADLKSLSFISVSQRTRDEKTIGQKESCTKMFIAALCTIARTWKQPKCPSTDEWMKKMWYIYTTEYYSAIKRNEMEVFVVRFKLRELKKANGKRIIWFNLKECLEI